MVKKLISLLLLLLLISCNEYYLSESYIFKKGYIDKKISLNIKDSSFVLIKKGDLNNDTLKGIFVLSNRNILFKIKEQKDIKMIKRSKEKNQTILKFYNEEGIPLSSVEVKYDGKTCHSDVNGHLIINSILNKNITIIILEKKYELSIPKINCSYDVIIDLLSFHEKQEFKGKILKKGKFIKIKNDKFTQLTQEKNN